MLARLLESRGRTDRPMWGAAVSTLVHTAVIGAAVFATAQARVEPHAPPGIIWVDPPIPSAPVPRSSPQSRPRKAVPIPRAVDVPDRIEVVTLPVDPTIGIPAPSPLAPGDSEGETSSSSSSDAGVALDPSQPFSAEHVERQAYLAQGGVTPRYPHSLRAAGIEGEVTALFVVSETGQVERGTLRFTRSDNPLFEAAVKDALERMRFIPAEVGGKKVRQLVQMPFVFRLASTQKR